MDSLFDDKPYEVGDEIEAYCSNQRCRGDTVHVIKGMYESEIRRVECTVCNDGHAYRKPRGVPFDEEPTPEPTLKKKASSKKKPSWEEAMAKVTEVELTSSRPYSTMDNYELLDVVFHPMFDAGFVTELLPDNKVEITFKDSPRILVHRKRGGDFASGISQLPAPRKTRSRRKRRKKGPSEMAQRLMSERMLAQAGTKNFEQVAEAKEELAERAAHENRRLALEMVVKKMEKGIELTVPEQMAAKEAQQLVKDDERMRREEEKERKRLEKEKEREKKRLEKEKAKEKLRLEKEKEREKARRAKGREQVRREREREKERKRNEREKERARRDKERDKERARKLVERDRARAQKERERESKRKAAERLKRQREAERKRAAKARASKTSSGASARRTGGKKTIPSARRTGGKKTIAARRR